MEVPATPRPVHPLRSLMIPPEIQLPSRNVQREVPKDAASRIFGLLAPACVLLAAGCAVPTGTPGAPPAATIHLVAHGWHTGIAIARGDLPDDFPSLADFPLADQLEFGWGDAKYYPAPDPSVWLGINALMWPTPSVLHVAAIRGDVAAAFPMSTVIRIELTADGLHRLSDFMRAEFQLDPQGRPIAVAPGLYGNGRFYRARGKFYFPRTCNWWIASALAAAGVPIKPATAVTARALLAQAARHGHVVQRR